MRWRPWARIEEGDEFPTLHGVCVYELRRHGSVTVLFPFHWPARWLWHAYQRCRAPRRSPRERAALFEQEYRKELEVSRALREENQSLQNFIRNLKRGLKR